MLGAYSNLPTKKVEKIKLLFSFVAKKLIHFGKKVIFSNFIYMYFITSNGVDDRFDRVIVKYTLTSLNFIDYFVFL